MPINAVQMDIIPGKPEVNLKNIQRLIEQGGNRDPNGLLVFPEMSVPGYFIGDRWRDSTLMQECHEMTDEVVAMTRGGLGVIFGNVTVDTEKKGENGRFRIYNSAIVAHDGRLVTNGASQHLGAGRTHKSLMPNYGMFHDKRHFTSLRQLAHELDVELPDILRAFELPINGIQTNVGVIICEDMWDADYADKPIDILREQGVTHMVNLSSSPFGIDKGRVRDAYLGRQSRDFQQFWYSNNVGRGGNGKNEHVFDGSSLLFENGAKVMQAPTFQEGIFDREAGIPEAPSKGKEIHDALIYAIRERWESLGKKKVVIGLSGGIDSAISATLFVQAIGADNVVGVNMPTECNGQELKTAASDLAKKLGIEYYNIPLGDRILTLKNDVERILERPGSLDGVPFENMQARDRSTSILAAVAGSFGGVFSCNGNKSEVFTGYCTLDGDARGFMAPIADLYKTQVRSLTYYMNQIYGDIVPETTLTVPASAELSPEQTLDTVRTGESPFRGEKGDPFVYPYHDALYYQLWDLETSPAQVLEMYRDGTLASRLHQNYDTLVDITVVPAGEIRAAHETIDGLLSAADPLLFIADLERVYGLLCNNFFKRVQAPTIAAVSRRPFGYDSHEAENGVYFGRKYRLLKYELLGHPVPLGDPAIQALIQTRGTPTPRKAPMYARLPKLEEIGRELITYVSRHGQIEIESRHVITEDMVICSNDGILGQVDGRDVYNEWPRSREYFAAKYGGLLTDKMQPFHKKAVATLVPAETIWTELGGKPDEDVVTVAVSWGTGTMQVYRDGYVSTDGNGIARDEYIKTYT